MPDPARGASARYLQAPPPPPSPERACRLVCVPHAGGTASVFHPWRMVARSVDVVPVQLPGRHNRLSESPRGTVHELVGPLADEVGQLRQPYALFGHSMGALVAFELARTLQERGIAMPLALFVSGYHPPDAPPTPAVFDLPRPELIRWMVELGGVELDLARDDELMDLLLPAVRADLAVVDTYVYRPGKRLSCPIRVLVGQDDRACSATEAEGWGVQSELGCEVIALSGGHFFVHDRPAVTLGHIERELSELGVRG